MNKPWYTSRPVTRFLGIAGCIVTLVASCQRIQTLDARASCRGDLLQSYAHTAPVFSTDSQKVFGFVDHATPGSFFQTLEAWETAHGRRLWRQPVSTAGMALATHGDRVATMTFKELTVRDTRTGRVLWQNTRTNPLSEHATLSFSPSGRLLALTMPGFIQVLDTATGKSLKGIVFADSFSYHQRPVFLSDGALAVPQTVMVPKSPDRVPVVAVLDPLTGKVLRRLARDVENWSVSPDGTHVLIQRPHELLLLRSTGETLGTLSWKNFEHHSPARFIPGSTNILLTGYTERNELYTPVWLYLWNPSQHVVRRAHADEKLHEQAYARDGSKVLRVEDMGGLGRHKPLGTVITRKTKTAPVALEGMTGWELK